MLIFCFLFSAFPENSPKISLLSGRLMISLDKLVQRTA